jgi:ubiquinone/menaquinone biosynthesis C-methylase UbiE
MDRNLFLPPIGDSPQRVIDIGTGTGIWAIDFGIILYVLHELNIADWVF